jgi:hypothetical protein
MSFIVATGKLKRSVDAEVHEYGCGQPILLLESMARSVHQKFYLVEPRAIFASPERHSPR